MAGPWGALGLGLCTSETCSAMCNDAKQVVTKPFAIPRNPPAVLKENPCHPYSPSTQAEAALLRGMAATAEAEFRVALDRQRSAAAAEATAAEQRAQQAAKAAAALAAAAAAGGLGSRVAR